MTGLNATPHRKAVSQWLNRIAALIVGGAMAMGGALAVAPQAGAQDGPVSSSGRVHYDHYRDRGGDRDRWHHRDRRWNDRRSERRENRRDSRGSSRGGVIQGDRSGPSGTFSGNVSAYRDRGNGVYFRIEGDGYHSHPSGPGAPRASGPRVIDPGASSGCADENGVCVIRPGQ